MPGKNKSSKYNITVKTDLSFEELLNLSSQPVKTAEVKIKKDGKASVKSTKKKAETKVKPKSHTKTKVKKGR